MFHDCVRCHNRDAYLWFPQNFHELRGTQKEWNITNNIVHIIIITCYYHAISRFLFNVNFHVSTNTRICAVTYIGALIHETCIFFRTHLTEIRETTDLRHLTGFVRRAAVCPNEPTGQ